MKQGHAFCIALFLGCGATRTSSQTGGEATPAPASSAPAPSSPSSAATQSASSEPDQAAASARPSASSEFFGVTVATSKAHTTGQHYALDVKAPARVSVGGVGELEIVLVAKDGYHINDEFPYKFNLAAEPSGIVTFERPELTRTQGTYTKTEARFAAKFQGARAGEAKIGGTIALSVCTQKECITDKIQLEVPVSVR